MPDQPQTALQTAGSHPAARPRLPRYLRLCGGFLALSLGIILSLPLVPGPGIPLILLGLILLSDHVAWARRVLDWARRRWRHIHDGR